MKNTKYVEKPGQATGAFRRSLPFVALALMLAMMVGCRTAPVKEVNRAPVPASGVTATQVRNAIVTAGAGLGWTMQKKSPGLLFGTLNLRSHMARVEIPYSATSYSIRYKDSSNLNYDASEKTIHSNYNGWVSNLNSAIAAALSAL
jgi:hypothetical protein